MEKTESFWYWKDIMISHNLVGETIKKGNGKWEKEYTYIKIPPNNGYDNYCFLLSDSLVHYSPARNKWWFSICFDMQIQLIYDPELRECGKKYKRYKLSGIELFEQIFKNYEVSFKTECIEREKKRVSEKEKRDRANTGEIVCGRYTGNVYSGKQPKYRSEDTLKAFFTNDKNSAFSNSRFDKVKNVNVEFVVFKGISKYHFGLYEDIINAYLRDIDMYKKMCETLKVRINNKYKVVTKTEDIVLAQYEHCEQSIEETRKRLRERIEIMLKNEKENITITGA